MDHFGDKFGKMKAREGDKQCWQTCWSRSGRQTRGTAAGMKKLWMSKMGTQMRANQCAQACWRKHHSDKNEVRVGGWRSQPRSNVCAK
jgi:hypothetical protein